jgi:aminoglycoside phosphotransferase (APT) family kinase protein
VADVIAPLHRHAQRERVVDSALLGQWVDEPAERIRKVVRGNGAIDRLVATLRTQLAGRRVRLGWTHGDFYPGNLLISPGGQVTGIVDWGEAREADLAVLDLVFWLLTVPTPGPPREFGARVAARLDAGRCWTPAEHRLLDSAMDGDPMTGRTLLLLAWLRHVAGNLAKSDRYASSPLWSRRNVRPVLRQVADG